ncbi:hypothetical protein L3Y34_011224 [Caenorhabditis briggsae]|uniref:Uncharacterized protein n=1 Tax=Caenorhabditis briggsae TaxID=6238 RepID=A0AAE9CTQ0_CAEBR|nr:hypothetical protein L3Y34_011224 [Caenorhabditis briggsae]
MKDNRRIWSEVLKALNAMEKDNGVEVLVPFMRSNGSSIEVMKNEGIDPEKRISDRQAKDENEEDLDRHRFGKKKLEKKFY